MIAVRNLSMALARTAVREADWLFGTEEGQGALTLLCAFVMGLTLGGLFA
ncbi:hypothetical protein [Sphingobium sp. YBL2]|nr:hypothetical protein [Sphingobium sp. YBL2]